MSAVIAAQPDPPLLPGKPPSEPGTELVITGANASDRPLPLWLRVDGATSVDFHSRMNLFRAVAPGAFEMRLNVADLTTAHGDMLVLGENPEVRVFAHEGATGLHQLSAVWSAPAPPPRGVIALDLGAAGGPVMPGFVLADETHEAVAGRKIAPVTRPGVDALARDGLAGVELLTLSPPPGRYRVKLWLEDLGAWEYVPHQLRHRVRINGRTIIDRSDTPHGWVRRTYLAGATALPAEDTDVWSAFGSRRAGTIAETVDIGPEGLRVELAGDAPGAVFVAAIAVVPEPAVDWLDRVEVMQATRFRARWPVDPRADAAVADKARPLTLAPGSTGWLTLDAGITGAVSLEPPLRGNAVLPASLRLSVRHLDRPSPNSPFLVSLARRFARPDLATIEDARGRTALVAVHVPTDAAPGRYEGALSVEGLSTTFAVQVAKAVLPSLPWSIGAYLADPPHHRWFKTDPRPDRACRLRTLADMGLTAVSPPLETPNSNGLSAFEADHALAASTMSGASLAYQEAQRLFDALGPQEAVRAMTAAHERAHDLVWSLADEPSNPGPHGRSLVDHVDAIRAAAPGIRLAAHLNAPADRALVDRFDVVLVNPGYGIDETDMVDLAERGVEAWIYNTGPERLAAGFYGWRVGATGYFQWHGLLPTADPFDPTDGREGDAMLLPPIGDPCDDLPAVDIRLVSIAEGAADRRWLAWLDARADSDPRAAALRRHILDAIPGRWDDARALLDAADLDQFRAAIAALAQEMEG